MIVALRVSGDQKNLFGYYQPGGLINFGPLLFDRVRNFFNRYNHIPQPVEFRFAELKNDFGIVGAAELVREQGWFRSV